MNIDKLLKPGKMAIVGAGEGEGFGGDTTRNAVAYMKEHTFYLVNPKWKTIFGRRAYPSLADLPEDIDLVVICTPAATVGHLIREAHKKGARAALVFASGYKETGTPEGEAAQTALCALCAELDMALMGPNCAGFVNYTEGIHAFAFLPSVRERKGKIGFVSQSGQLCYSTMESPVPSFSCLISAGNAAVTKIEDYIEFLLDDPDTKVIALYFEGIQDGGRFAACLKKAAGIGKPVVALKTGRSEKGERVAASHTGSLAGSDRFFDALFEKFGVIRVEDLEELIYTAQTLAVLPKLPAGKGIGSMNLSGGETGICADLGERNGIEYPDFTATTLTGLTAMLPPYATPANPLDMTATLSYDTERYAAALRCVMNDPGVDLVLVGYTLTQEITDPAIRYMADAMEIVRKEANAKPILILPFTGNTRNNDFRLRLEQMGVPILPPPQYAFPLLANVFRHIGHDSAAVDDRLPIFGGREKEAGGSVGAPVTLTEHETKTELAHWHIPVPAGGVAVCEEDAADLASRIGFPAVMKISSPDILHKSDVGGVAVGVTSPDGVREAYRRIMANVRNARPGAAIDGILVERLAPPGTEMIVGVKNDPRFGPAIMTGLGGVFVEVFRDTALRLAPVSAFEALEMIHSLKGAALLGGYRGKPPLDVDAFANLIADVSAMAAGMKEELIEMDLNPVFVCAHGVLVADAVMIKRGAGSASAAVLRTP
ncbi:MAG: acetate--CoA ligase family protein [Clostridiales Family XIII bacterium]|jgi:acetyltransferase|nr:acetate--CoA ligase family protein [Clostridiales Family XIII bacterium]